MEYPCYIIVKKDGTLFPIPTNHKRTGYKIPADRFYKVLPWTDDLKVFRSVDIARGFLKAAGYTSDEIEQLHFLRSIGVCQNCGAPLFPCTDKARKKGYRSTCHWCDEDFFSFEQTNMLDEFASLPESGFLTKQNISVGDRVFIRPDDALPVTIKKVYGDVLSTPPYTDEARKNGSWNTPMNDGFDLITGYPGLDWAVYKNDRGEGAAIAITRD